MNELMLNWLYPIFGGFFSSTSMSTIASWSKERGGFCILPAACISAAGSNYPTWKSVPLPGRRPVPLRTSSRCQNKGRPNGGHGIRGVPAQPGCALDRPPWRCALRLLSRQGTGPPRCATMRPRSAGADPRSGRGRRDFLRPKVQVTIRRFSIASSMFGCPGGPFLTGVLVQMPIRALATNAVEWRRDAVLPPPFTVEAEYRRRLSECL